MSINRIICPLLVVAVATVAFAQDADQPPSPDHLPIAGWRFSPERATDQIVEATYGYSDATLLGATKLEHGTPPALILDGKTARVVINQNLTDAYLPRKAIAAEAWVRVQRPQQWAEIIGAVQDNGGSESGWLLGYRDAKFCIAIASRGAGRLTYLTAPQEFTLGAWYHVVGTYDGKKMKLFLDGKEVAQSTEQQGAILYPPRGVFGIGAYHDDDELFPIKGSIHEVNLFERALSADEVAARFEARKAEFPGIEPVRENVVGWPTYMRDNARSGFSEESVTLPLNLAWKYKTRHAPRPAWPPPADQDFWHDKTSLKARVTYDRAFHVVSDGRCVYFGSSADDNVRCLDLATGQEKWSFFTEGPVRLAPSLWEGKVYVGSDDGFVYCLSADEGELIWKFRAAPEDRRIPGNSRMISAWPVRSGVLIEGGHARFAAGIFPEQGAWQFAFDANTGKEIARGQLSFSPQGYMQRRDGRIAVAQGRTPGSAELAKLQRRGKPLNATAGQLQADFPFALIRASDVRFAGGDGKVAAFSATEGTKRWEMAVDGRAYSLAFANQRLLVSTDRGMIHCFATGDLAEAAIIEPTRVDFPEVESSKLNELAASLVGPELRRGYCLVLGTEKGRLAYEIARDSEMQVIAVEPDAQRAEVARRNLAAAGVYGRAVVHNGPLDKLPYGSGLFNLIVSACTLAPDEKVTPASELRRLLRPGGGVAYINHPNVDLVEWLGEAQELDWKLERITDNEFICTRPALTEVGEWTHMYAGPGNTACSGEQRLGGSLAVQWFGPPGPQQMIDRHHRTVPPLFKSGRLFIPGNERVIAVDAYNGTVLWNVEVAGARRVAAMRDAGSMVATEDYVYLVAKDRCYGLAAETGESRLNFAAPKSSDGQPRDWGYVARVEDRLFGSTTKPGAVRTEHNKQQISETYYDFIPVVTSDGLFCLDRHSGDAWWRYESQAGAIINSTITMGRDRVYFVESTNPATLAEKSGRARLQHLLDQGGDLVALDGSSGEVLWRRPFDSAAQHCLFLCYVNEKLVSSGAKNKAAGNRRTVWYDLQTFDAATGKRLWSVTQDQQQRPGGDHGEQDHHPAIVNDIVYQTPFAYDLHTGKKRVDWKMPRGGHGCGAVSASASAFFFRAGNATMCDLATGQRSKVTSVSRPGCWINMIPAGGLLLMPEASSGCTCDFPVQSSMAFTSDALSGDQD